MNTIQPGILEPPSRLARYLMFTILPDTDPKQELYALRDVIDVERMVVGFGQSLLKRLGVDVPGLKTFPIYDGSSIEIPSTPVSLWCWIRGEDRGELIHQSRSIQNTLENSFEILNLVDAFQYGPSLDLTGYIDGTENPQDDDAINAAIIQNIGPGMDGASFVAVQQWVHDLDYFQTLSQAEQDNIIGRRKSDNEELDEAPLSAHVKRTAQESFNPEAFVLRRSMPWADSTSEGLFFVAFGNSFDAFEAQLNRMVGLEDGTTDGLFRFTQPISGSYFWCPPVAEGKLDLSILKL